MGKEREKSEREKEERERVKDIERKYQRQTDRNNEKGNTKKITL